YIYNLIFYVTLPTTKAVEFLSNLSLKFKTKVG
ncbi:unnamed protein product, partial [marine sediment metagenome]